VRAEVLEEDGGVSHSPSRGDGRKLTVRAGNKTVPGAELQYEDSPIEELHDLIRLDWDSMGTPYPDDIRISSWG
jgi:hypothetical protein